MIPMARRPPWRSEYDDACSLLTMRCASATGKTRIFCLKRADETVQVAAAFCVTLNVVASQQTAFFVEPSAGKIGNSSTPDGAIFICATPFADMRIESA